MQSGPGRRCERHMAGARPTHNSTKEQVHVKRTDQPAQGAAPRPPIPEPPLAAQMLYVVGALLRMNPTQVLTQDALDHAFKTAAYAITAKLPTPVAEDANFWAQSKLPVAEIGTEHAEYADMLTLIAGTI